MLKKQNCNLEVIVLYCKVLIQLTLTETKPHIKTKAVLIIDFDLVITVSPAGYLIGFIWSIKLYASEIHMYPLLFVY